MPIDLRSDTVTIPTPEMLKAMMSAQVGDDVFGEDPSVRQLEEKLASMFGKERGLFCPSGTMSNQIAIRLHTQPGDEVLCHRDAHVYKYEGGGIAVNSHCSVRLLDGAQGKISAEDVRANINDPLNPHFPLTRLVCLEDTSNRGGGSYYSLTEVEGISRVCADTGLALHLDGARLFNALVETNANYCDYARNFATISICLSKGLGAPVGSLLLGSREHIAKAIRIRKVMGGGMRQAGYLAAAGIYALDHHVERLRDDHRRAKTLASALQECSFVTSVYPCMTNIVIFELAPSMSAESLISLLREQNILALPFDPCKARMVTHLGIDDAMVQKVVGVLQDLNKK
jgi:threonine aldolase